MHYVRSYYHADGRTEAEYIGTTYTGPLGEFSVGIENQPDIYVDAFDTYEDALQGIEDIKNA